MFQLQIKKIYFQFENVDIAQKDKYLVIILEEHLDFKAGINELCSEGGI